MSEASKFYVNKRKKAQLKHSKGMEAQPPSSSSPATTMTSSSTSTWSSSKSSGSGYGGASKPPVVPKKSSLGRFKFLVPIVLTINIGVGASLFMRTNKKDVADDEETTVVAPTPAPAIPSSAATIDQD